METEGSYGAECSVILGPKQLFQQIFHSHPVKTDCMVFVFKLQLNGPFFYIYI